MAINDQKVISALTEIPMFANTNFDNIATTTLGGLNNNNYHIIINNSAYVLRLPKPEPTIDRIRERKNALIMSDAGISPKILYSSDNGIQLTPYLEGRTATKQDLFDLQTAPRIIAAIKKMHNNGLFPNNFDLGHEIAVLYAKLTEPHNFSEPYAVIKQKLAELASYPIDLKPCHIDLHLGNIYITATHIKILDWEYAANFDPYFDLCYLLIAAGCSAAEEQTILALYNPKLTPEIETRISLYKPIIHFLMQLWHEVMQVPDGVEH